MTTSVTFPLVFELSQVLAAQQAIQVARDASSFCEGQIAFLQVRDFFKKHPYVQSVSCEGEHEGDDEGGSYFSASFSFDLDKDSPPSAREDRYALSEEFEECVREFAEALNGETFQAVNLEAIGKALMGGARFAQWQAAYIASEAQANEGANARPVTTL